MAGPLSDVAAGITAALDDPELRHIVGRTAKDAALEVAADRLGPDRAFSGFRRRVPLRAGYDVTAAGARLNLWPEGLWKLADKGRSAKGRRIIPRRARRRRRGYRPAVSTPAGPRNRARITASRPLRVLDELEDRLDDEIPDAIDTELLKRLRSL